MEPHTVSLISKQNILLKLDKKQQTHRETTDGISGGIKQNTEKKTKSSFLKYNLQTNYRSKQEESE